jgi:hypothetical protein
MAPKSHRAVIKKAARGGKLMKRQVLGYSLLLFPILGFAQITADEAIQQIRDRFDANQIFVRGSVNPEAIPYGEKMAAAFGRFARQQQALGFQEQLRNQYRASDADVARITQYASQNRTFMESVEAETGDDLDGFCTELLDVGASVVGAQEIAARLTDIKERRLSRMEAHYREAVDGLGPTARSYLMNEIDGTLVRGMNYGTVDDVGLAADLPELFPGFWEDRCERRMQQSVEADSLVED